MRERGEGRGERGEGRGERGEGRGERGEGRGERGEGRGGERGEGRGGEGRGERDTILPLVQVSRRDSFVRGSLHDLSRLQEVNIVTWEVWCM